MHITKSSLTITSLVIDKPSSFEAVKWESPRKEHNSDSDIQTSILNKPPRDHCKVH